MRSWASSPAADPICVASSPKDVNKSSKNGKFEKILKGSPGMFHLLIPQVNFPAKNWNFQ